MISFVFPLTLQLDVSAASNKAPEGIAEVLTTILKNIVDGGPTPDDGQLHRYPRLGLPVRRCRPTASRIVESRPR